MSSSKESARRDTAAQEFARTCGRSTTIHHANAFKENGHDVQIFLLGEAVTLMRSVLANAVVPVGWPPLSEALAKVVEHKIPIHV
jgi:predicted peroxiredoxin